VIVMRLWGDLTVTCSRLIFTFLVSRLSFLDSGHDTACSSTGGDRDQRRRECTRTCLFQHPADSHPDVFGGGFCGGKCRDGGVGAREFARAPRHVAGCCVFERVRVRQLDGPPTEGVGPLTASMARTFEGVCQV